MKVADKSYFSNADKSKLVAEGSADAAYLVVGKGAEVTPEMEEKYKIKGVEKEEVKPEAGIVTTGSESGEGFIPAEVAQSAGVVVPGAPAAVVAPPKAATKPVAKKR